jgi:hypothetical protein
MRLKEGSHTNRSLLTQGKVVHQLRSVFSQELVVPVVYLFINVFHYFCIDSSSFFRRFTRYNNSDFHLVLQFDISPLSPFACSSTNGHSFTV